MSAGDEPRTPRPFGSATISGPQKPLLQSMNARRAGSAGSRHVSPLPTTSARMPLQSVVSAGGGADGAASVPSGALAPEAFAPGEATAAALVPGPQAKPSSQSFSRASRELRSPVKSHLAEPGTLTPIP